MFDLMNHLIRDDAEARADMFMTTLIEEITNDEETYQKKCRQLARALLEKDAEGVIIALCGWSPRSIATKAMLIRDTEQEFHNDDFVDSEIIVEWSNGDTTEGECAVNPVTHEVKDFNPAIMRHEGATIKTVGVAVGMDSELFECVPASAAAEDPDAFWYTDGTEQDPDYADRDIACVAEYYANFFNNGGMNHDDIKAIASRMREYINSGMEQKDAFSRACKEQEDEVLIKDTVCKIRYLAAQGHSAAQIRRMLVDHEYCIFSCPLPAEIFDEACKRL